MYFNEIATPTKSVDSDHLDHDDSTNGKFFVNLLKTTCSSTNNCKITTMEFHL